MKRRITEPLLESIAEICPDGIHKEYSGRGMCGETCFGFEGDYTMIGEIIADMYDCTDVLKEFSELLMDARTDSFGFGIILYFPGWTAGEEAQS